ncbi:hypothetical protein ACFPA1_00525 [Neobacillus sp. GCM10023253]|uniref:hypothetical protein n=1 Tax=Neobacillus sp. GCM10023253 TaxID=3252644 RepID=UPI003606FCB9
MKSAAIMFFVLSAIFFMGTGKFVIDLTKPGVYPPKQIIKKRAAVCASGGGIFLVLALLFTYFF